MPLSFKVLYRWSVKLLRVSLPLKLKNASYVHRGVEEEDDDDEEDEDEAISVLMEAIGNILINHDPQFR